MDNENIQTYQLCLKENNTKYEPSTSTITYQFKNIQHGVQGAVVNMFQFVNNLQNINSKNNTFTMNYYGNGPNSPPTEFITISLQPNNYSNVTSLQNEIVSKFNAQFAAQGSTPTSVSFIADPNVGPDAFQFVTNTITGFTITGQTRAWYMLGYETAVYNITTDIQLAINYRKANLQAVGAIQVLCPQLSNPNNPYEFPLVDVIGITVNYGQDQRYMNPNGHGLKTSPFNSQSLSQIQFQFLDENNRPIVYDFDNTAFTPIINITLFCNNDPL